MELSYFLVVVAISATFVIFGFILLRQGVKVRKRVKKLYKVKGELRQTSGFGAGATASVIWRGQEYIGVIPNLYSLRKRESANLLFDPSSGGWIELDIWTENGKLLLFTGTFLVLSSVLVSLFFSISYFEFFG